MSPEGVDCPCFARILLCLHAAASTRAWRTESGQTRQFGVRPASHRVREKPGFPDALDAVAAAPIGFAVSGAAKPNAFGTVIAAPFVRILPHGLTMPNAPCYTQDLSKGSVPRRGRCLRFPALGPQGRETLDNRTSCKGGKRMKIFGRALQAAAAVTVATVLATGASFAQAMPDPFDSPGDVRIALVRYLSAGDFFQAYLSGVERQAEALGVGLRVFDSRQDAALQARMMDEAVASGVDGIVIQHGLTKTMKEAARRAVGAGVKVVAFDVDVENEAVPQIEQSDHLLARLALEQAIRDNGDAFEAGYAYVPGIAPLDRRHAAWEDVKAANPGIVEKARIGTLDNPIASSVAKQARSALQANPGISVFFAPYNEFARGVKAAVDEAGMSGGMAIYSADVSATDIALMREPGSAWKATVATNPAVVGEVSVRALAMMLAGEDPGAQVTVPPALITQDFLNESDIRSMEDLSARMPRFAHADVAMTGWMPLPPRPSRISPRSRQLTPRRRYRRRPTE